MTDSGERARSSLLDALRGERRSGRTAVPGPARHVTITPDGEDDLGRARLEGTAARDPRRAQSAATTARANHRAAVPGARRRLRPRMARHVWVTSGDRERLADIRSVPAPTRRRDRCGRTTTAHRLRARAWRSSRAATTEPFESIASTGSSSARREVPIGSYNVAFGAGRAVTPSLWRGTVERARRARPRSRGSEDRARGARRLRPGPAEKEKSP